MRCQPGPWLGLKGWGRGWRRGCLCSAGASLTQTSSTMHFWQCTLSSCFVSQEFINPQGEEPLLPLRHYQSCFWLQALCCTPLSCKWVSAATPSLGLSKKKKKRIEKSSRSLLFASLLQELITQWEQHFVSLASAILLPTPSLPQDHQSGCSRQVPEKQEAQVAFC